MFSHLTSMPLGRKPARAGSRSMVAFLAPSLDTDA